MTVNFNFNYVLNLHNREKYINAIEQKGLNEDIAYKKSLVQVNRDDIKVITKMSNCAAYITLKSKDSTEFTTLETYDEIHDTINKSNIALDIMRKHKIYAFDDFEVDSDELNIIEGFKEIENEE